MWTWTTKEKEEELEQGIGSVGGLSDINKLWASIIIYMWW